MPLKRKTRNLPTRNDQVYRISVFVLLLFYIFKMSFFDPVYQNDDENENDLLADGIPRPTFGKESKNESNETLDTDTIINSDQDQSLEVRISK